ncbi:bifunctional phosphoribosyl-AMP cyclohydrolase/phosphoribosyl-ATP diphosphatase HisIE [Buchnera aphidicola]|uniref:Histidine biosynthesis bifunctional protein HisIE n=1 Tax=Buchnera aphidicola subsp. Schizaphis graminum (strain Sg) TaxID=198804 RepID=HIS2_BUCAP|nr:bifunctional phosphoribosyl-AMP cyclohydrolase/phosphoribosyl-ATP diphosphatase HisIE [Buchnera aphidicola]Q9ZHE0.2 RecName: Full=Histidine biosynthesis bifunctional protein HisIE; Includes: RecName: Full=Phosphoribosyl-AMP cyclohydrolase; Short=PRA-CH; Includes: RecName: Full=Phosphoribosyl-ATP pyrophosphatase; Short=PRA-PH [Buchnera aphidicola str. Sg (Schizaphis graminum)]AAM67669.1 histidine biosynthesis bifunctional protein [Buchnera aphidicola str. Sg (Schizaphis graminum)]AWI49835.1 bi
MLSKKENLLKLDWIKTNGLIPAIIQDFASNLVLMHGYMNKEAFLKTQKEGFVTFYSRTKKRLWTKGEESGNLLKVIDIVTDCDYDTILIIVEPLGKTCHLNRKSCFFLKENTLNFLSKLEDLIEDRKNFNTDNSYTARLYKSGTKRIAQKVGEEAIETILAAMKNDGDELINESSDLIYHLIVLLHDQNLNFNLIIENLKKRKTEKL